MAPTAIRDRRRILRYRNLVQRQAVQMKNRISGLLVETGVPYDKLRLYRMGYFSGSMSTNEEIRDRVSRAGGPTQLTWMPVIRPERQILLRKPVS